MNYSTAQLNLKYQLVIPKEVRKIVHIKPNESLGIFTIDENTIMLKKIPKSIRNFKGSWNFPEDYLNKERLSW